MHHESPQVVWDREMEAEKKVLELEEALREYHSRAAALQLIPRTAKRANGMQYEIVLNSTAAAAGDMLTVDMKVRSAAVSPGTQFAIRPSSF
jgi:kinetochore protein NDC80